jgi:glycosyltransferase involved in cell wall biosynthesis
MGICLNMIVRNESKNLPGLFASIHDVIDYFVIADTGSDDNTVELIHTLGATYNIPGIVISHQWIDFAHNRNLALEAAVQALAEGKHSCNWLMIIDADEELVVLDPDFKSTLIEGYTYSAHKRLGEIIFNHFFLIWIKGQRWKWEGRIHNYLMNIEGKVLKKHLNKVFIKSYVFEGAKSMPFKGGRDKAVHDAHILMEELQGINIESKNVHRFFQLGNSLLATGDLPLAVEYLEQVAEFTQASKDVRYISLILISKSLMRVKAEGKKILSYLEKALSVDESRLESYYYRSVLYRQKGDVASALALLEKAIAMEKEDRSYFYQEADIYEWKLNYELAFVYFQLKKYSMSGKIIHQLLEGGMVPEGEQKFITSLLERIENKV